MANIYDQFDDQQQQAQAGNPYDQFDAPEQNLLQKIGGAYDKRVNNVQRISDVDAANGVSAPREAAHIAGEGFGMMKDAGGAVLGSAYKTIVPESDQQDIAKLMGLMGKGAKAVGLDKAADYVGKKYDEYVPENTPLRQDLNAAGNFGAVMSGVAPVADAIRAGQAIAPAVVDAAKAAPGAALKAAKAAPGVVKNALTPGEKITADAVREEATKAYNYADTVGGTIAPEARDGFLAKVNSMHPASAEVPLDKSYSDVLEVLNSRAGQPLSLQGAQDIDKFLGDKINGEVMVNGKLTEAGKKMSDIQSALREYTRDPDPAHIVGGAQGFEAWQQGQKLWQKQAQLRDIENILAKADVSDNAATIIKNGFGRLSNDARKMRGYDPAIQAMIKNVATSNEAVDFMRKMGSSLIPQIGAVLHGAPGAILGEAVNFAGKKGATAVQVGKAAKVAREIAKDSKFTPPSASAPLKQLPPPGAGTNFYADNLGNVSRTPNPVNEIVQPGAPRDIRGVPAEPAAAAEVPNQPLALPHPSAFDNFQVDSQGNVIPKQGAGVAGTGGLISNAELARMKPADALKYLNSLKRRK